MGKNYNTYNYYFFIILKIDNKNDMRLLYRTDQQRRYDKDTIKKR
jgi:hypothetical protein